MQLELQLEVRTSFLLNLLLKEHIALFPNLDYKNFSPEAILLNNLGYHFRWLWWPATTFVRTSGACRDESSLTGFTGGIPLIS